MKPKSLLPVFALGLSVLFASCKKDDTTANPQTEIETTFDLTADQAVADNLSEDANDVFMQVAEERNLTGNFTDPVPDFVCATVTVTPQSGFPKTVVIDFGTGCTNPATGITRSGIIRVVISDSLRHPGSTATMTFENYFVNLYKIEGTYKWTNTSTATVRSWRREVIDGKVTAPTGRYWLHNGVKEIVQIAGADTHNPLDDIFRITGHSSVTNSNGNTRTALITEPLRKKVICHYIDTGRIRFEGPNHFAILDFGNGDCDDLATIVIDGQTPHTIHLP